MIHIYLLALLSLGCISSQKNETAAAQPDEICLHINGYKPCNFTTIDANNETVDLHDFEGSPFILDISAMWCGPCQRAGMEVQFVQDSYSNYGLKYITLLIEDNTGNPPDIDDLELWAQTMGITTAPILAGNRELLTSDPTMTTEGLYLRAWPTFYFFDSDMRMIAYQVGADESTLETNIQMIID